MCLNSETLMNGILLIIGCQVLYINEIASIELKALLIRDQIQSHTIRFIPYT